jgi:heme-degrading monooxygenase HmoA
MFVLFVDMNIKPGSEQGLEKTYIEIFRPAISRQEGFHAVELLRSNKNSGEYRLSIVFQTRPLQQKWVATDLHQDVWSQMESHSADHAVKHYTSV